MSTRHGHLAVATLAAALVVGDATTAPAFTPAGGRGEDMKNTRKKKREDLAARLVSLRRTPFGRFLRVEGNESRRQWEATGTSRRHVHHSGYGATPHDALDALEHNYARLLLEVGR